MPDRAFRLSAAAFAAGAALLIAGCGQEQEPADELQANLVYGEEEFDQGNDLSAMEMAGEQAEQPPANEQGPVLGEDGEPVGGIDIGGDEAGAPDGAPPAAAEDEISGM